MKKYLLLLFAFSSFAIVSCEKDDHEDGDHDYHDHIAAIVVVNDNIA